MATMFRNLLKSRHDAKAKAKANASSGDQPPPVGDYTRPSATTFVPVDYNASAPSRQFSELSTTTCVPVEYTMSPLAYPEPASSSSNPTPLPVSYTASPPPHLNQEASKEPAIPSQPTGYYMYQPAAELPGHPIPPRYELPNVTTSQLHAAPKYLTPDPSNVVTPRSPSTPQNILPDPSARSPTPSLGDRPSSSSTFGSSTTLIPSPARIPILQSAPNTPDSRSDNSDGIRKYTLDIFCPLKRDATGHRREQIPRDVREFRLAKVALIPIVAGQRRFLSLDVVFGEMDRAFSALAEKHFAFSQQTQLVKLDPDTVRGGRVYTVGPLNIAYRDGDSATIYVRFHSEDDESKFESDFYGMLHYVEH